jgi:3-hydroxy-9,10-secoandrosta-1,3,5(10)-triene-9,17-dione monooxygenase reductase component
MGPGLFVRGAWRRPDSAGVRELMGLAPAPVAVLSGRADSGAPLGLTISSFTSISLEPPLALVSVAAASPTWAHIAPTGRFAVNLLADDQEALARRFASRADRYAGVRWESSPRGVPILAAGYAAAEFAVFARHPAGDHEIVLGELLAARVLRARGPLTHHRGGYATAVPLAPFRDELAA